MNLNIEKLKADREQAIMQRHNNICRAANYFNSPSLKRISAEIAIREIEEMTEGEEQ